MSLPATKLEDGPVSMDPRTPQRPPFPQPGDGHLADASGASPQNGKVGQRGDEQVAFPVEVADEAAAQAAGEPPAAPLAEARRGGRYSPNRSTGLRAHSHYTPNELEERAKNAWYWTQLEADGFNTKSELVIAGMTLMCELLEEQYNDGQLFPPAPEQTRRGPSPAGTARQSQAMRAYWNRRRTPDESAPVLDPAPPASADPLTVEDPPREGVGRGERTSPLWGPEP